ncbi:unnamed protein product [marine sediment metagenome]|uniref:Uncharacterized protein n=1 Tax=marine sediment metagenome TaxID=412755 RepID=X1SW63_9ZZZZ
MPENNEKPPVWIVALWDTLAGFFTKMFESVWSGFMDMIPHIWSDTHSYWSKWFGKRETAQWNAMLDMFVSAEMIDADAAANLLKLKDVSGPLDDLFYFYLFYSLSSTYMMQAGFAVGGKTRQSLNKKYSPEVPHFRELIPAAFIAPEKTGEVRDAMKRGGISDEDIDLAFLASYRLYTEMDIRTLWLRGVLNDDQMFMRMRELGYTDTRKKTAILKAYRNKQRKSASFCIDTRLF